MNFFKFKTRKERLTNKLNNNFLNKKLDNDNISEIINLFNQYEKDNINTINKLKKTKELESKRISGALKQTINAHGPITYNYIGSATKRILGSLLSDDTIKNKQYFKIHKSSLYLGLAFILVFLIFIFLTYNI